MRSATNTFLEGNLIDGQSEIYVYAVITTPAGNTFRVTNSHLFQGYFGANSARYEYNYTLKSVSSVSASVDPFTREVNDSDCEVEILDEGPLTGFRLFQSQNRMLGSTIDIRWTTIGTQIGSGSDTTSVPYWKGQIVDVIPEEGYFKLACASKFWLALQRDSGKQYFNKHPLELISTLLQDAGVPTAFIDTTSLTASTWTDISHFVVSTSVYSTGDENTTLNYTVDWERLRGVPR
jgi:hypothetical protein